MNSDIFENEMKIKEKRLMALNQKLRKKKE